MTALTMPSVLFNKALVDGQRDSFVPSLIRSITKSNHEDIRTLSFLKEIEIFARDSSKPISYTDNLLSQPS